MSVQSYMSYFIAFFIGGVAILLAIARLYLRKHRRCENRTRLDGKTVLITGEL